MSLDVIRLADQFLGGDVRDGMGRPDLAMRMGIARAHRRTSILEDLHVVDFGHLRQFLELSCPGTDHGFYLFPLHGGQREVMARGEADHSAQARFALGDQQSPIFQVEAVVAYPGLKRREVVLEDECAGVTRIEHSADPGISRTEIASRVILGLVFSGNCFDLPLPWPARPMGRDQHPLIGERV